MEVVCNVNLSYSARLLLLYFVYKRNYRGNQDDISEQLGMSKSAVSYNLNRLSEFGFIDYKTVQNSESSFRGIDVTYIGK